MSGGDIAGILMALGLGGSLFALAVGTAIRRVKEIEAKTKSLPQDPHKRALAIAQERYARGELSREEYLELRGYLSLEETNPV